MTDQRSQLDHVLWFLRERAKELNCLYRVEELLAKPDADVGTVCRGIIEAVPAGWQYPDICKVTIRIGSAFYASPEFAETPWVQRAAINSHDHEVGEIAVYYTAERPHADEGPFLKEETKLIRTIADRLGHFLTYQQMKRVFVEIQTAQEEPAESPAHEWQAVLDVLRQTDRNLYLKIARKMLNHLCWSGVAEAERLVAAHTVTATGNGGSIAEEDSNVPHRRTRLDDSDDQWCTDTFTIAERSLSDAEIVAFIQERIQEDKLGFLVRALNQHGSVSQVIEAVRRYNRMAPEGVELPAVTRRGVTAALIRRFFSEQTHFVDVAREYLDVRDFSRLFERVIFGAESHGKLGGKSAGMNLAAHVLQKTFADEPQIEHLKIPRTWYLTSDCLLQFMYYNNLEEIVEQKYKELDQIRLEYPHIVQTFKSAHMPPEILQGLSVALDDLGDKPLIVRSSSLMEDQAGAAFSGKYKSLFLANRGSKAERLAALCDAIAEVYASTFGPDPIEYRAERKMLDFYEEMGIMIQEVVGTRIGDYYFPSFAGVAFSRNEFRWSPRIRRTDGLIRMVPGLGTRAVDRLSDDYPVLVAPGQPGLRVNVSTDDAVRYAPHRMDVINLKTNSFESVDVLQLLRACDGQIPGLHLMISLHAGDHLRMPMGRHVSFDQGEPVVTFEGLMSKTDFLQRMQTILTTLEQKLGTPVDIEFAHDGTDFYLLQCRPQSFAEHHAAAPIPTDILRERVLFTARRYVSNGKITGITHVVYVDPQAYGALTDRATMLAVGRAIGRLNSFLPKRQFILMGPGRWGSRGDIKLGVSVTYSDINNTSAMIEIARKLGNYVPDLSFGTHFFQDLVEADIRYLPLYPDDEEIVFNESFFRDSKNMLSDILPEFASLAPVIKLIDVPAVTGGLEMTVLMNADEESAIGILNQPRQYAGPVTQRPAADDSSEPPWKWRLRMAEQIGAALEPQRFGVKGLYVIGSTKNASAGPASDLDVIVHVEDDAQKRGELAHWLEGWSLCLGELNYARTGLRTGGLLDVHYVTDRDITERGSYAVKINAATDPARPIPLGRASTQLPNRS